MERNSKLNPGQLSTRVGEVFEDFPWHYESIDGLWEENGKVTIWIGYTGSGPQYKWTNKQVIKSMKRRPQAVEYLLGLRDDFND